MKISHIAFLLCLPLACSSSHYVNGLLAKDRGDYETAYLEFSNVSPSHPIYPRAQKQIAEIRGQAKAVEKTRKAAESAISRNDRVAARIALKRLLALKPGDPWAQDNLKQINAVPPTKEPKLRGAVALIDKKRFYEANSILENFRKSHPKNAQADALLKKVNAEIAGREPEVESLIQEANKAEEDGNIVSAYIYYEKATSLLPEDERAREGLDGLEGKIDKALDDNVKEAQDLFTQGKGGDAVDIFELNLQAKKNHAASKKMLTQTLSSLALDNYRSSNYDQAVEYWKKLLVYDPRNSKAREYMKKAQKLSKRVKEL